MSVEYDPEAHEDATTVLVWPNGRSIFTDDLDDLIHELKSEMVAHGIYELDDYTIISEERDISITEIQQDFLSDVAN